MFRRCISEHGFLTSHFVRCELDAVCRIRSFNQLSIGGKLCHAMLSILKIHVEIAKAVSQNVVQTPVSSLRRLVVASPSFKSVMHFHLCWDYASQQCVIIQFARNIRMQQPVFRSRKYNTVKTESGMNACKEYTCSTRSVASQTLEEFHSAHHTHR